MIQRSFLISWMIFYAGHPCSDPGPARTAARRLRIASMRPTGVSAVSAGQAPPSVSAALSEEVQANQNSLYAS
jgi:hypothetical protein